MSVEPRSPNEVPVAHPVCAVQPAQGLMHRPPGLHGRSCTPPPAGPIGRGIRRWHAPCSPAGQEVTTMMPTALMIPAALPPGLFGAMVDPGVLVAGLGAVVAAVAVGLIVVTS